jgi:hypothetical protein
LSTATPALCSGEKSGTSMSNSISANTAPQALGMAERQPVDDAQGRAKRNRQIRISADHSAMSASPPSIKTGPHPSPRWSNSHVDAGSHNMPAKSSLVPAWHLSRRSALNVCGIVEVPIGRLKT